MLEGSVGGGGRALRSFPGSKFNAKTANAVCL